MEEKIDIAELLKDCPSGMELDCAMYEGTSFVEVTAEFSYPIVIETKSGYRVSLTRYGQDRTIEDAKCVIFPKGKTTWEGFVPPCPFKDGDIIFVHTNDVKCNSDVSWVSIFKEYRNNRCACYVCLCLSDLDFYHDKWEDELLCELCEIEESRIATEEEKQKLFNTIKEKGYRWDAEKKVLEKLEKEKFDIANFKPFDKVLTRDVSGGRWSAGFFSHYEDGEVTDHMVFVVTSGVGFWECIPYEGNEHLLGTTDDCDEYYKSWNDDE